MSRSDDRGSETFEEWLALGVERGYCSEAVCETHDGLPSTDEEDAEWEAGHDPCVPAVRLYPDESPLEGRPEGARERL